MPGAWFLNRYDSHCFLIIGLDGISLAARPLMPKNKKKDDRRRRRTSERASKAKAKSEAKKAPKAKAKK